MIQSSTFLTILAIFLALAPIAAAQPAGELPTDIAALRLGQQVAGSRTNLDDLEGRVVLAYHWCVT